MYLIQSGKCLFLILILTTDKSEGKGGLDLSKIMGDGSVQQERVSRETSPLSSTRYGELVCLPNGYECNDIRTPCCAGMSCVYAGGMKSGCAASNVAPGELHAGIPVAYPAGYPVGAGYPVAATYPGNQVTGYAGFADFPPEAVMSKPPSPSYTRFLPAGFLGMGGKK